VTATESAHLPSGATERRDIAIRSGRPLGPAAAAAGAVA
jgi:hypothetical protein